MVLKSFRSHLSSMRSLAAAITFISRGRWLDAAEEFVMLDELQEKITDPEDYVQGSDLIAVRPAQK
jgi:hypothetical protein